MCQHTVLCYNEHRKDFVNFCKFTMERQISLEIIGISTFWVTGFLTANRLLSNTAEEVQPQRCRNICVTQHFADAFNVNPIFDTARRISVTECVIAAFSDATLTQDRFKVVLIGAWLHWLIRSACQDIRIL